MKRKLYCFLVLWCFYPLTDFGQSPPDTLSTLPPITAVNSAAFKINVNALLNTPLDSSYESISYKLLIKRGVPLLLQNGSGRIFETNFQFNNLKRLDKTRHDGYCYGASVFVYHDTIFSIGGYGFWTLNGVVRYFDEVTSEWSFLPTDREIPYADGLNSFSYVDLQQGILYLIYQSGYHENIHTDPDSKKASIKLARLDIRKRTWGTEEFEIDSKWAKDIGDFSQVLTGPDGLLLNSSKLGAVLYFSFKENRVYRVGEEFKVKVAQLFTSLSDYVTYWKGNTLQIFQYSNKNSIEVPLVIESVLGSIYNPDKPERSFVLPHHWVDIALVTLLIMLMMALLFYIFQKRRAISPSANAGTGSSGRSFNTRDFFQLLTSDEKNTLLLILTNSLKEKRTSIEEINKVAGIHSRPYKIQNNLRAELISTINKTYSAFNEINDALIIRTQASFDRRYVEYQINSRFLKKIDGLMAEADKTV